MKNYETILVERDEAITTIKFNRPSKKNAMNPRMHEEMSEALDLIATDVDTRVLVLTGEGDTFCAGMDVKEVFYDLDDNRPELERIQRLAEWRSHRLRLFPKPTIAAVNGGCFGGAFTTVASCDIVIAAEEATFGLSEINFGKIAGGTVSKSISEIMNPRDSLYYILTGDTFDGRKAAAMHLATMAVPLAELTEKVREIASLIAQKNPVVARATKEGFKHAMSMNYEQAKEYLATKSQAVDFLTGTSWRKGVEQFQEGSYRPGLGHYDWQRN